MVADMSERLNIVRGDPLNAHRHQLVDRRPSECAIFQRLDEFPADTAHRQAVGLLQVGPADAASAKVTGKAEIRREGAAARSHRPPGRAAAIETARLANVLKADRLSAAGHLGSGQAVQLAEAVAVRPDAAVVAT